MKWIDVKEERPQIGEQVLAINAQGKIVLAECQFCSPEVGSGFYSNITHWAKIPILPEQPQTSPQPDPKSLET